MTENNSSLLGKNSHLASILNTADFTNSGLPLITRPVGDTYSNGANSLNSGNVCVMLDARRKNCLSFNSYFKLTLGYTSVYSRVKTPILGVPVSGSIKFLTFQATFISSLSKRTPTLPDKRLFNPKSRFAYPANIVKSAA